MFIKKKREEGRMEGRMEVGRKGGRKDGREGGWKGGRMGGRGEKKASVTHLRSTGIQFTHSTFLCVGVGSTV